MDGKQRLECWVCKTPLGDASTALPRSESTRDRQMVPATTAAGPGSVAGGRSREAEDAELVESAVEHVMRKDFAPARQILLSVVARTPASYQRQTPDGDGGFSIRFWDQDDFLHFVTWTKPQWSVTWVPAAYPIAYYYLGFMALKDENYQAALNYLDRGLSLEPTQPMLLLEKAKTLVAIGKQAESLELYRQASEIGPHVSGRRAAIGLRGQGFVLIEMGQLEQAEQAFAASLKLDPDNEIALHELQYIQHLRAGGPTAPMQAVRMSNTDFGTCAICKANVESGTVANVDGVVILICNRCHTKATKKWWQFWK